MLKKIKRWLRDPYFAFECWRLEEHPNWMSDDAYIKCLFRMNMGYKLSLDNPMTFNEKLQWMKLYDRNPLYTTLVDKYKVKQWVANIIGEEYIIPTLAKYNKVDEINIEQLPLQFVLKCNHDSGSVVICKDKRNFDIEQAKIVLKKSLEQDYYHVAREWPYKNVERCIIAEPYLEDNETKELIDYKFFTFDGVPKAIFIATGRQNKSAETTFDFYDMNFNHIDVTNGHPNAIIPPQKPYNFELMSELASRLGNGLKQVRVDFYEVNGKVYFGEMTLFHWGGVVPFVPNTLDIEMGQYFRLPFEDER